MQAFLIRKHCVYNIIVKVVIGLAILLTTACTFYLPLKKNIRIKITNSLGVSKQYVWRARQKLIPLLDKIEGNTTQKIDGIGIIVKIDKLNLVSQKIIMGTS